MRRRRRQFVAAMGVAALCAAWVPGASSRAGAQGVAEPRPKPPSAGEAEVLALDQRIADAVVRGDTAFVDSVTPPDFVMVHGDGWAHGGQPLLTDTKASMLRRVTQQYYDVLDFDSVKAEMHGDVAITYGRYLAHTARGDDPSTRWFSVWFERVYARRDRRWIYLSHRTVHGPTFGRDRESVRDTRPLVDHTQGTPGAGRARAARESVTPPDQAAAGAEVLAFERAIAASLVRGDVAFMERAVAPDFVMVHGDGWTHGERPALLDDRAGFMKRVSDRIYDVHDYDVQAAEMHGDVAVTYGRYIGYIPGSPAGRRWFYVWYEKVYAKRDGRWVYLSHRTVDGAHYGDDRRSVSLD